MKAEQCSYMQQPPLKRESEKENVEQEFSTEMLVGGNTFI